MTRKAFPRLRVASHSAHAAAATPAWTYDARTEADLVIELLPAESRPTNFLSRRMWREVGAAGGGRRGRGSP